MTSQHPPGLALSQYVDSELPADRREEVGHHLERCDECRTTVDFYRRLRAAAGKPREVIVPDVADRVLRRRRDLRASGDRTLAGGDAQHGARRRLAMAASVAAALLIGSYLILAPSATAHRSSLRFESSLPQPGDVVDVEYSPSTFLADRDSLRLRIRARSAESPFPRQGVIGELRTVTLYPNEAGRFESQVQVRPGDVYLAAAVEDFEGENVDTNLGRLWDVLVSDSSGHPSTAALESKYRVLEPYNWVAASAWAAEATEQYPDNPFGWTLLYVHQSRAGARSLSDSLSQFHRTKLSELAEGFRKRSADQLEWLALYAEFLDSRNLREALLERLSETKPQSPVVINERVRQVLRDCGDDSSCRLASLDRLWQEISNPSESLARLGLATAAIVGDESAIDKWISRSLPIPGVRPSGLAAILDPFDGAVVPRTELRKTHVAELSLLDDSDRPLRLTRPEFQAQVDDSLRWARSKLAVDLVSLGDTAAALAAFAEATDYAWKPEILKPYIDLLIASGDTAPAIPLIGLLAADPLLGTEARRLYSSIPLTEEVLARQRAAYRQRVRDSTVPGRKLPEQMDLSLLNGGTIQASEFVGSPVVLFKWEADLPRAYELLQEFDGIDASLWSDRRIQRLIVTHTTVPSELHAGSVVIYDPEYELSQQLGAYRVPSYVVLNADLRVITETADIYTALRIASAFSNIAN